MNQDGASDNDPRLGPEPGASSPSDQSEEKHPEYRINIYRDWCKSCGICAAFCPRQCLSEDAEGNPVVDHAERCTGCRWCELHCPDFAICVRELVSKEVDPEDADKY
jgi:2-oxoglutarate ferredoxin oxidoreductase subunit delta